MARRRTVIALLLGLTLVAQGLASAQSTATLVATAPANAESEMPCHDMAKDHHSCCDSDSSCPDMLTCLTGHAVVPAMAAVVPPAQPDLVASLIASRHTSNQPPTVFRPPIVIHG
jgi:hypothetical protein